MPKTNSLKRVASKIGLVALLLMSKPSLAQDTKVVTLVGDPWPPYITGELGQQASGGVGFELMRAIFDRLDGVELSVPLVPWNRALREVEQGSRDGIGILLKTAERQQYMDYTEEIFRSYNTVWYSTARFPDGFEWQRYLDLKPYNIGIIRGHSYGGEFDQLVQLGTLPVIELSSVEKLFAMLDKGRIDMLIADKLVGDLHKQQYADSEHSITSTSKLAADEIYHIAFSKKSEARHLIPAINRVVAELADEGEIQRLLVAAGLTEESPVTKSSEQE